MRNEIHENPCIEFNTLKAKRALSLGTTGGCLGATSNRRNSKQQQQQQRLQKETQNDAANRKNMETAYCLVRLKMQ